MFVILVLHCISSCSTCLDFLYWYPFETSFLQSGASLTINHHSSHVRKHASLRVVHRILILIDAEILASGHWGRYSLCFLSAWPSRKLFETIVDSFLNQIWLHNWNTAVYSASLASQKRCLRRPRGLQERLLFSFLPRGLQNKFGGHLHSLGQDFELSLNYFRLKI